MIFSKKEEKPQQTSSMIIEEAVPKGENVPGQVNTEPKTTGQTGTSYSSNTLDDSNHAPTSLKYTSDVAGVNAVKGVVGTSPTSTTAYTKTQVHETNDPASSN